MCSSDLRECNVIYLRFFSAPYGFRHVGVGARNTAEPRKIYKDAAESRTDGKRTAHPVFNAGWLVDGYCLGVQPSAILRNSCTYSGYRQRMGNHTAVFCFLVDAAGAAGTDVNSQCPYLLITGTWPAKM